MKSYVNEIEKNLTADKIRIEYYDTLPSTNAFLKERVKSENEGLLVIADSQTAGRGRFTRKFHSPQNSGIYMSLLLKPQLEGFDTTLITTGAAVAVAKAIEALSGKKGQIKWVNDVLIDNKKVCGILTEGAINPKTQKAEYVILGIGINAFTPKDGFAEEIKEIAGSVFDLPEVHRKAQLTAAVINNFWEYYSLEKDISEEYRKRCFVLGKNITVIKGEGEKAAKAIDLDNEFRLLVEYKNKTREYLSSGEISIKLD